jgi:hypothetical protein
MSNFNTNTLNKEEWLTPKYIIDSLGPFDLDPCASTIQPWKTATTIYTKEDDGLNKEWLGRVWCNPPYGRETFKWINKLSTHKSGLALIFCRTETKGFHSEIWNKAESIFFFKGRLYFCNTNGESQGPANAPSCLVSFSISDSLKIENAFLNGDIKGKHVILNNKSLV